jgi:hypothetical protein
MEDTIRRLAHVLGGSGMESLGHDHRFYVEGSDGSRMKVLIEAGQQRLIAELTDPKGIPRGEIDVGPIRKVTEDPGLPGRITLHCGTLAIHLDSQPALALAVTSSVL